MRFILIDRLLSVESGRRATASKVFPRDLEIFADHFPGRPIVPGTLITEAMGQTAGWLLVSTLHFRQWPLLTTIDQAKFFKIVVPGTQIVIDAALQSSRSEDFELQAEARVDGERVARARFLFRAAHLSADDPNARTFERWARQTFAGLNGDGCSVS